MLGILRPVEMHPHEKSKNEPASSPPERCKRLPQAALTLLLAALLASLVCAAYTCAATGLLWVFLTASPSLEAPEFLRRLALKGGVAAVLVMVLFGIIRVLAARCHASIRQESVLPSPSPRQILWLLPALILAAALMLPNLAVYPRAAPDELHHLIVAKNLAEYGLYASGHPAKGFKVFDPFDSVGAPVLLPVAGMFKLFGVELAPARLVIAAYFLGLCIAVWFLVTPLFGPAAGAGAAMLMTVAFSSTYLGRTLYGEVPGLFFLITGLLFWRYAITRKGLSPSAVFAGCMFGLAILCKTVLLLSVFAVAGAVLFDGLTHKRIRPLHLLLPAIGATAVVGTWFTVQTLLSYGLSENAGGTLGLYRQYLLPGAGAALRNSAYLMKHPYAHVVMLCCVTFVVCRVFRRQYDPPLIVLLLAAAFYAYWWFVFTPGRHVRYLWYGYAVSGLCVGITAAWLATHAFSSTNPLGRRAAYLLAAGVVTGPWLLWASMQGYEIHFKTEMAHDRALAAYVAHLPADAQIGSTFYPVRGTIMFLAGRWVDIDENHARLAGSCDVLIEHERNAAPETLNCDAGRIRFGPYIVTTTRRLAQAP